METHWIVLLFSPLPRRSFQVEACKPAFALNFAVNLGSSTHFKPHLNPKRRAQGVRAHLHLAFSVYKCPLRKCCGLRLRECERERERERDQGQSIYIPEQFCVRRRSSTFPKIGFLLKMMVLRLAAFLRFSPNLFFFAGEMEIAFLALKKKKHVGHIMHKHLLHKQVFLLRRSDQDCETRRTSLSVALHRFAQQAGGEVGGADGRGL